MSAIRKALVVDDDEDFVLQQQKALETLGFVVTPAFGRQDAMEKLEGYQPDLAIVDLMMEEKDGGFVLAHYIKKLYPQVPVILVTAVAAETGLQFDLDVPGARRWIKADAILTKPVRLEQLKLEIERVLP